MKFSLCLSLLLFTLSTFKVQAETLEDFPVGSFEAEETDNSVLDSVEALKEFEELQKSRAVFDQTRWLECSDAITGNYTGFNCTNRRGISVILDSFKNEHFHRCVNQALNAVGKPQAVDLHVTHDGVQGDANHSPRSLHAEARAVDVDSFVVYYSGGSSERLVFEQSKNNAFFNAFRSCWGRAVHENNGCPLISGTYRLTGSIGKEDSNHQHHMHVSVPYCVRGNYAGKYYRR